MSNIHDIKVELKNLLDILYQNKEEDIESVRTLSEYDNQQSKDIMDAYNKIVKINTASIGTVHHDVLIDIVDTYEDHSYNQGTFGEFLFGCIDVDVVNLNESCRPECKYSLIRNEHKYKKCTLPVWRMKDGKVSKLEDGEKGAKRGLFFIDDVNILNINMIPIEVDTIDVHELKGDESKFINTYRNGKIIEPSIGSLQIDGSVKNPLKRVRFKQIDGKDSVEELMTEESLDTTLADRLNELTDQTSVKPGEQESKVSESKITSDTSPKDTEETTEEVLDDSTTDDESNNSGYKGGLSTGDKYSTLRGQPGDEQSQGSKKKGKGTSVIQSWITFVAVILLVGLGFYILYRFFFNKREEPQPLSVTPFGSNSSRSTRCRNFTQI